MRSRFVVAVMIVMVAVTAVVATLSMAAGPKQYQWTGTVTEIDPKAKTMNVDKAGDVWEFSTEGLKDLYVRPATRAKRTRLVARDVRLTSRST